MKVFNYYFDLPKGTMQIIPFIIIESLAMSVSFLISIYFIHSLKFSSFEVGRLISFMSLGVFIGSFLSGYLTTKFSALKTSSLGLYLYGINFFFLYKINSPVFLIPVMFFCGVGGVLMMIANLTALIKLAKDDLMKNRVIVIQAVIFNVCASIAGILFSYLGKSAIENLFLLMGFALIISGILLNKFSYINQPNNDGNAIRLNKINFSKLGMIVPVVFFYGIIFSIVKVYFPATVIEKFSSPFLSSLVLSANPIFIIFIQPTLIGSLNKTKNTTLLGAGGILLGAGYFLYGYSQFLIASIVAIIIATIGEMMFSPISKKIASQSFGDDNEGMGIAAWKMTYYASGAIGAYFMGYFGHTYGSHFVWISCLTLSFLILAIIVLYGFSTDTTNNEQESCGIIG